MKRGSRSLAVIVALVLIGSIKLGQHLYRYYAYSEERRLIVRLEQEVEIAGGEVIETQVRAEELRRQIESTDEQLAVARQSLERLEQQLLRGNVAPAFERSYRQDLAAYNESVGERNAMYREWRSAVESNRHYVGRYNQLADSIRTVATAMGEPYYPVLTPAEIAARRGAASDP